MKKNYFGICEWALPVTGPLAIRLASDIGFDGIQLSEAGGTHMNFPLNNSRVQSAYLSAATEHQITLHSINLGALLQEQTMFYEPHTSRGDAARLSISNGILACHHMNIPSIVCTVSPETKEGLANSIEHLKFACAFARQYGITITMESILPLNTILYILDRVGPELKICMDILNPLRFGSGDPIEQILTFSNKHIHHFHMKDSLRKLFSPTDRGCVLLGTGDVNLSQILDSIKKIDYCGWYISENYYYLPPLNVDGDFFDLAKKDLYTLTQLIKLYN